MIGWKEMQEFYDEIQLEEEKLKKENGNKAVLGKKRTAFILDISVDTLDRLREESKICSRTIRGQVKFRLAEIARFIVEDN